MDPVDAVVFEDAPAGIAAGLAAGLAAGIRIIAVGPNTGELPDGVLHIPDYSAVSATVEHDEDGHRTVFFRL